VLQSRTISAVRRPRRTPEAYRTQSTSSGKASSDRHRPPLHAHFHSLTRSCADSDWRPSANQGRGSLFRHTAVLRSRYMASVDHTGLLRRSPRCSVITQRARVQQRRAVPATASVSSCAASCFVARVLRASREEKTASPIPAESHVAGCMPAARKEAI
jgi:hypothetical protein